MWKSLVNYQRQPSEVHKGNQNPLTLTTNQPLGESKVNWSSVQSFNRVTHLFEWNCLGEACKLNTY